jgi:polyferredoxin
MDRPNQAIYFLSSLRNRFQLAVFILTLVVGVQFFLFVDQAGSGGAITIPRPAGVEGFLPIGALLAWKRFLISGVWDPIHPAAMVILLFTAVISFLFHKAFCSWFCPIGTLSEWFWKLGYRLVGKNLRLPAVLDWPLRSFKYLLLGFFVIVAFNMSPSAIASFLNSPYYKLADVEMLHFFTRIGPVALTILGILIVLSVFIRNFWCRYLCPYGALMGLFALTSPTAIKRSAESCNHCRKCSQVCPSHLAVHKKFRLTSPACSGCMDCMNVCPSAGTLSLQSPGSGIPRWQPAWLALSVSLIFVAMVTFARISGHWQSAIQIDEFRRLLRGTETTAAGTATVLAPGAQGSVQVSASSGSRSVQQQLPSASLR